MAKLSAHGTEVLRYFSVRARGLVSLRSDGYLLVRRPDHGWKIWSRLADTTTPQAAAAKLREKLAPWKLRVTTLPTCAEIHEWSFDGLCATTDGDNLEPDYRGDREHGPSWLVALGYV